MVEVSTLLLGRKGGPEGVPIFVFRFFILYFVEITKIPGPSYRVQKINVSADGRAGPINIMTIGLCSISLRMSVPIYVNVIVVSFVLYLISLIT